MKRTTKYVALDVHQATTVASVRQRRKELRIALVDGDRLARRAQRSGKAEGRPGPRSRDRR